MSISQLSICFACRNFQYREKKNLSKFRNYTARNRSELFRLRNNCIIKSVYHFLNVCTIFA